MKVYPYGAINIGTKATGTFKVNRSRLKHYLVLEPIEGRCRMTFLMPLLLIAFMHSQAHDLERALFWEVPRTLFLAIERNKEEVLAKKSKKKNSKCDFWAAVTMMEVHP